MTRGRKADDFSGEVRGQVIRMILRNNILQGRMRDAVGVLTPAHSRASLKMFM
jgi:hypothetical protein